MGVADYFSRIRWSATYDRLRCYSQFFAYFVTDLWFKGRLLFDLRLWVL
jgi:hypothetical protein